MLFRSRPHKLGKETLIMVEASEPISLAGSQDLGRIVSRVDSMVVFGSTIPDLEHTLVPVSLVLQVDKTSSPKGQSTTLAPPVHNLRPSTTVISIHKTTV